jgi:hypothetical protein
MKKKFDAIAQSFAQWECSGRQYKYDQIADKEGNLHKLEHGEVITGLLYYFSGNSKEAKGYGLDTRKGIRIVGNTGSGKTLIMRIFMAIHPIKPFYIKRCPDVVEEYNAAGDSVLKYGINSVKFLTQGSFYGYKATHMCFDDLGKEPLGGHFAKKNKNVMGEILDARYDHWIKHGQITHITDNINDKNSDRSKTLEGLYGDRIEGRIFQMTNKIILGGDVNSVDFRRL